MTKQARVAPWAWLVAGVAMALAFWFLGDTNLSPALLIALKGASVAALAAYALAMSSTPGARWIAAVMAIGAAGDVGMELDTIAGGGLFLLSHLVAIAFYLRNLRAHRTASQQMAAASLVTGIPLAAWALTRDPLAITYAFALGMMAATAWLSRFSRYHVGIGVLLFVASDLIIFARLGARMSEDIAQWLVWPLYYAGQLLISTGVIRTLRREKQD